MTATATATATAAGTTAAGTTAAGTTAAGTTAAATTATAAAERTLRIGELAVATGTTPRTIRYYEEIGLLGCGADRTQGKHRCYTEADVQRVSEIIRLRDLLGLSLEQLSQLLDAESARAHLRREYQQAEAPDERRRILEQALAHLATQLELVQGRRRELEQLAAELEGKQASVRQKLGEVG